MPIVKGTWKIIENESASTRSTGRAVHATGNPNSVVRQLACNGGDGYEGASENHHNNLGLGLTPDGKKKVLANRGNHPSLIREELEKDDLLHGGFAPNGQRTMPHSPEEMQRRNAERINRKKLGANDESGVKQLTLDEYSSKLKEETASFKDLHWSPTAKREGGGVAGNAMKVKESQVRDAMKVLPPPGHAVEPFAPPPRFVSGEAMRKQLALM